MRAALKKKWVAALRSGKYKQGTGCGLHDPESNEYCCLGVLARCTNARERDFAGYSFLPSRISEKAELPDGVQNGLADKNDSGRWSFGRIATWIEKNL